MNNGYYSVIGILAIIIHVIINVNEYRKTDERTRAVNKYYRLYLLSVFVYYITDALWGIIDYMGNVGLLYVDTLFYYFAMASSIVFWCGYVISYLNLKGFVSKILKGFGITFWVAEIFLLTINHFHHVFFWFDEAGEYQAYFFRYAAFVIQVIMFASISVLTLISSVRSVDSKRRRNITISIFGFLMAVTVVAQIYYPMLPIYSMGLMVGTILLHVFVEEDEKEEYRKDISLALNDAEVATEKLKEALEAAKEAGDAKTLNLKVGDAVRLVSTTIDPLIEIEGIDLSEYNTDIVYDYLEDTAQFDNTAIAFGYGGIVYTGSDDNMTVHKHFFFKDIDTCLAYRAAFTNGKTEYDNTQYKFSNGGAPNVIGGLKAGNTTIVIPEYKFAKDGYSYSVKVTIPVNIQGNKVVSSGAEGVSLQDNNGTLPIGAKMSSTKLESGSTFDSAKQVVEGNLEKTKNLAVYEMNLNTVDDAEIHQLAGKVVVKIKAPFTASEGYTLKVYRVDGDKLVECKSEITGEDLLFETDHFSTYVFVEVKNEVQSTVPNTGDMAVLTIITIIMLLTLTSVAVMIKKRHP